MNLEKKRGNQNQIRKLIIDEKEIDGDVEIFKKIESFYETLFKSQSFKNVSEIEKFLCDITTPSLNKDQINLCKKDLSEPDLYNAMKNMQNNKSPGNDGLTKEFYEGFWDEIKELLIASATEAKHRGELSISQRQAIIKLIEKKDRDKRYIKNWRPISLLNVDTKIISKALSERLKNVLSSLISTQQTAYIKNRFIGEGGRLISDIVNICDRNNIGGFLVTIDIEKAFYSLDHKFILIVLKKFGFGKSFVSWVASLLNSQESCVINEGITTRYFCLQRRARQGDSISAYVFILCLEILFILIKNDPNIKGIEIFEYCHLYTLSLCRRHNFFLRR